ncbi:sigma-70 family RNA polymerase sigma factor [Duganella sp. sic0402]|uniref:sigma-70 family RNA polymerase sigma factor n=1 Tax=Duganella sp. sic0402 TaxID=2854786 RepID=UPI0035A336A8
MAPRSEVGQLYAAHHSWLLGWLRRKVNGADHAADLAQETFIRILCQADHCCNELREPRAYLATVAQRLLINYAERQSLERAYLEVLAQLPPCYTQSPEERLLILEALHDIDRMLDGLPPKAREAFLLSQLEGLGYSDIGERLGVTVRTVKRYMAAAFMQCLMATA